jgi:small subunit ribosomal protein S17
MPKKRLIGKVVSDKMKKTIVVLVERWKAHPKYKKRFRVSKKYHAHDEKEEAKVGDLVMIEESRPYSKTKRFKLVRILEKAEKE